MYTPPDDRCSCPLVRVWLAPPFAADMAKREELAAIQRILSHTHITHKKGIGYRVWGYPLPLELGVWTTDFPYWLALSGTDIVKLHQAIITT